MKELCPAEALHEECGVFGIYDSTGKTNMVSAVYSALYALQHRGQMPGQMDGQSGSSISISKGSTFTIRSSDDTAVYTGEAVYDARFVFFSSAAMTSGETYALTSGGTELATATAGGTGTAAVTTPDTSADTTDTHQTSDSHTALYITLGTVAVLGAAAVVVVVLRKQKKA